jgi:dihydroorotate dehydrogenase (NAD+) catalytic subunit
VTEHGNDPLRYDGPEDAAPNSHVRPMPEPEIVEPPTLEVDLDGVRLPTPVLAASGCFNVGREVRDLVDLSRVGGIVTKSVTLEPTKGLRTPRMAETSSGMLNAIGLQNPGVEEFLDKEAAWIASLGTPVVVSVAGKTIEEFSQVTIRIRDLPNVVALEANISCPNVERRNMVFACHANDSSEVIGNMTRLTGLPVFAKLTADVTDIVDIAEVCVRAGAHGLSLINTLLGMAINTETFRPKLAARTGGLSGPAIRPIAVRCVYQVARALPGIPIIGIGGVSTAEDAVELMAAGAWAVQVGTASFSNPNAVVDVADGIAAYLARRGMHSPGELVGRVFDGERAAQPAGAGA